MSLNLKLDHLQLCLYVPCHSPLHFRFFLVFRVTSGSGGAADDSFELSLLVILTRFQATGEICSHATSRFPVSMPTVYNKRVFSANQSVSLPVIFLNLAKERGAIRKKKGPEERKLIWGPGFLCFIRMSADIDAHISKKYEIKKRLGKGVSLSGFRSCNSLIHSIDTSHHLE